MSNTQNVCLIGGSGFLGTELADQISRMDGKNITVLTRDVRRMRSLRVVPTVNVIQVDPYDPEACLLYTSPSPRDRTRSRMPSSA